MSTVKSLSGQVLEGWERGRTGTGIPYYINHKDASTHWDHPEMTRLLDELQKYNSVRYAAYRTAEKMRHLINALRLNLVRWTMIDQALLEHGYRFVCTDEMLNCFKLEALLFTLCELGQTDTSCTGQSAVHAELLLNMLLNMFDKERKSGVNLVSSTIVLGILCSGKLLEKYKYISHQFIDRTNFIMKKHVHVVLTCLAKIPELFGEKLSFGCHLASAALENCCKQNCGLSEEGFLEWLFREPQTLVWLPTYARLKASELVVHPVRCSVCKLYPIVGMRYCCLRCLRYDTCQSCFFRGRVNKAHKLTHPMKEFCQPTTSWEETKTLLKTLKNRMNRWPTSAASKPSYLPISIPDSLLDDLQQKQDEADAADPPKLKEELNGLPDGKSSRNPTSLDFEHRRELESIIVRLEDENRHISQEINRFNSLSDNGSSEESRSSQGSWEAQVPGSSSPVGLNTQVRNFQAARQEMLEDHAHMMSMQTKRLRQLLQYLTQGQMMSSLDSTNSSFPPPPDLPLPPIPLHQKDGQPLESTPIFGRPHVPPHKWTPFVKLQSELEMLEHLTNGLQEASNSGNGSHLVPESSPSFFQGTQLRRSCRGVSFTDRCSAATAHSSVPKESKYVTFQRQGSVRTNTSSMSPSFSAYWSNPTTSVYDNCSSSSRPFSSNYFPSPNSQGEFEDLPMNYHTCASSAVSVPRSGSPLQAGAKPQEPSRADAELQAIIDQLEKVLPNSWSSTPSLLPEEKAKVLRAVTEVEEAMAQFLNCNSSQQPQPQPQAQPQPQHHRVQRVQFQINGSDSHSQNGHDKSLHK